MVFVYFVYGLSFFALGLAVLVYPKRDSVYPLASDIWLIGAFGVVHGINEWLEMFRAVGSFENSAAVSAANLGVLSISFTLLLVFVSRAARRDGLMRVLVLAPLSLPVIWLLVVGWIPERLAMGPVLCRYLLGFPGAFLTGVVLVRAARGFRGNLSTSSRTSLVAAGAAFMVYAVLAGLLPQTADFFPASVIHDQLFHSVLGIPIQAGRAFVALVAAASLIRSLDLFRQETHLELGRHRNHMEELVSIRTGELSESYAALECELADHAETEKELSEVNRVQDASNRILRMPLEGVTMRELLGEVLDEVGGFPWASDSVVCAIWMNEGDDCILQGCRGMPIEKQREYRVLPSAICHEALCGVDRTDEGESEARGVVYQDAGGTQYYAPIDADFRHGVLGVQVLGEHAATSAEMDFVEAAAEIVATQIDRIHAESELRTYSTELEETNQLKDLFIDILRHDLLGPLGVVQGMAKVALAHRDSDKLDAMLEAIVRNSQRMIDLIDSASLLGQLEVGEELNFEEVDLAGLLESACEEVQPIADERRIEIHFEPNRSFPAHANKIIVEVFVNLLSNAIKYGDSKSEVHVSVTDGGNDWHISVANRGESIPDRDKTVIFERFKRAQRGPVKGVGLGLAIVKRVVDAHGGSVRIKDHPEGGAIFVVEVSKQQERYLRQRRHREFQDAMSSKGNTARRD